MTMRSYQLLALALLGAAFAGCRGGISSQPPVHLVQDMDFQPKLKAQSRSSFEGWADHRSMRVPPAGTIAHGAKPDAALANKDASNAPCISAGIGECFLKCTSADPKGRSVPCPQARPM